MRPTYQAFATMGNREWLVLWRGEPGDSAELVARIAAMRIAHFDRIDGAKRVKLAQSLVVFSRSAARKLTPLRRYLDNHIHGPLADAPQVRQRSNIIRGPWPEWQSA